MNASSAVLGTIMKVMNLDRDEIEGMSYLDDDLKIDDTDMEEILGRIEDKLGIDLIDFYDSSEVKTVIQLVKFVKRQMEM